MTDLIYAFGTISQILGLTVPFYFAFKGQSTRAYRVLRIVETFLIASSLFLLASWLWSHTPEPNDAAEGAIIGVELIFSACILAGTIALIRGSFKQI